MARGKPSKTLLGYQGKDGDEGRSDEWDDAPTSVTLPPFLEVELVYESGKPRDARKNWRAIELWTANTVYSVNWAMRCIRVQSRQTSEVDEKSQMLGFILTGGQVIHEDSMELVFPCPRPGTEAVFESPDHKQYLTTSLVERAVLRLRVLSVDGVDVRKSWTDLTTE